MKINLFFQAVFLIFLVMVTSSGLAETAEERGRAIAEEMDQRDKGFADYRAQITMTLVDRGGAEQTMELGIEVFEMNQGEKSLILFRQPRDIGGTALLTHAYNKREDDQWLFLPALKRVKRISSKNRSGAFVGSEFAYEDLLPQSPAKYDFRYLKNESCGKRNCYVIERIPRSTSSGYSRQVLWIDQQCYIPLRAEFFDRAGIHVKTLVYEDYKCYLDKYWRAARMLMENQQTSHKTLLEWRQIKFRNGLQESNFLVSRLEQIR